MSMDAVARQINQVKSVNLNEAKILSRRTALKMERN